MSPRPSTRRRERSLRVLLVVSRFNDEITSRLLDGAQEVLRAANIPAARTDVVWVPGAFELPVAVHRGLATGRYACAIALGAVVRGETPHFDYVARAAAEGLVQASTRFGLPVGFGVLTCDTWEQALARSGGEAGNKGKEAARAALETLDALRLFDRRA